MIQQLTKVLPIVILGVGLIKGVGKTKSLFHVSRSMAVQTEVNQIARTLKLEALGADSDSSTLPSTPEEFSNFIRAHVSAAANTTRDPSVDMWGTPYALVSSADGARVLSLGPDKQQNTADDVVAEVGVSLNK